MEKVLKYFKKINNVGSIVAIASLIIVILTANHINVDGNRIMDTVKSVCSILVILGILNNPATTGLDLPGKN
ncbi:phage holin [uncultured Clostridium sp.]|uniref:phage holin n=1 Tax=uncultured Clostridium sp. TaxID=59620 RepID=UPI00261BD740|nr:phage holin [uncultured Clostridium sp.]